MWYWALEIDRWLFNVVNRQLAAPFLDVLLPFMRKSSHWYPAYGLLVLISLRLGGWRAALSLLVAGAVTILISDAVLANGLKHWVERIRPCNDPRMQARLLLKDCGSGFSFVSAHACNHMALAILFGNVFRSNFRFAMVIAVIWAAIISFAQVYCGVHYPSDVICGAILGAAVGYVTSKYLFPFLYKKFGS